MLHVNCKIAVLFFLFENVQVLTIAKTDTKVKKPGFYKYLHCSVDLVMVLRAQELAPSGIMLVILSQKCNIYKAKQSKNLENLAPKRVWLRP